MSRQFISHNYYIFWLTFLTEYIHFTFIYRFYSLEALLQKGNLNRSVVKWIDLFNEKKLQKKLPLGSHPACQGSLTTLGQSKILIFSSVLGILIHVYPFHYTEVLVMIISIYFLCTSYLSRQSCNLHAVSDIAKIYIEKVHLIFSYLTKKFSNSSYCHTRLSVLKFYKK